MIGMAAAARAPSGHVAAAPPTSCRFISNVPAMWSTNVASHVPPCQSATERPYWRWRSRNHIGRPTVSAELCGLIREPCESAVGNGSSSASGGGHNGRPLGVTSCDQEVCMRNSIALLIASVLGLSLGASPSRAEITYPWCAQYADGGGDQYARGIILVFDGTGGRNCGFWTLEQCRAALSGNGGWCEPNPMYRPGRDSPAGPRQPRRPK
jgi:hypothetical protein